MDTEKTSRATAQKNLIKEIVYKDCSHPTAERIYAQARKEMPKISLGTVYRVLNDMVESGEARLVAVPNGKAIFDHTVKPHAHFQCKVCGKVCDTDLDCYDFRLHDDVDGNLIEEAQIMLTGVCKDCRK